MGHSIHSLENIIYLLSISFVSWKIPFASVHNNKKCSKQMKAILASSVKISATYALWWYWVIQLNLYKLIILIMFIFYFQESASIHWKTSISCAFGFCLDYKGCRNCCGCLTVPFIHKYFLIIISTAPSME